MKDAKKKIHDEANSDHRNDSMPRTKKLSTLKTKPTQTATKALLEHDQTHREQF